MIADTTEPIVEDATAQIRRRYQQKRCLVCGARNRASTWALFCTAHIATHRYCPVCIRVGMADEMGNDRSRCRTCSRKRALEHYYRNPDRTCYAIRLRQMHVRSGTRGDQIMDSMRRRIALAELVRRTPGMSWRERGLLVGRNPTQMAYNYRNQCQGPQPDADEADRGKRKRGRDAG